MWGIREVIMEMGMMMVIIEVLVVVIMKGMIQNIMDMIRMRCGIWKRCMIITAVMIWRVIME